jgi:hypothetical protein
VKCNTIKGVLLLWILVVLGLLSATRSGAAENLKSPGHELWEGQFSQCSYNAVATVLDYFYGGPSGHLADRKAFEKLVFADPLNFAGYGAYFGWAPWTSYMVESGKMTWNGQVVSLKAERFSLRPVAEAQMKKDGTILVHYEPGERRMLRQKLLTELGRGPVVMWTPYAGMFAEPSRTPWHQVMRLNEEIDAVTLRRMDTHSVTLFLHPDAAENKQVGVVDCSVVNGIYATDPDTIISTSAAMTALVRQKPVDGKSLLEAGFSGIKNDEYNVVFFKGSNADQ